MSLLFSLLKLNQTSQLRNSKSQDHNIFCTNESSFMSALLKSNQVHK